MIINQNITTTGECWSEKFGIPCCKEALMPLRTTYDGGWSQENGEWCGLGESLRPIDDIPPPATPVYKLKDMVDPAADCDISDVIHGDSLGQEAPFRFGVGLYGNDLAMSTITSEKMRKVIKYQFNSMTYTNLMNPSAILDQQASIDNIMNGNEDPILNFSNIVDGLDFAYKNGLNIRGHALVWHTQVPEWFFRDGYYSNTEFVSRDVMEYRLDSYIRKFLGFVQFNYPGTVDVWDVVNEAIEITDGQYDETTGWYTRTANNKTPNPWYEIFGPDYVAIAFRIARKYALPNVKLIYNDHNTFQIQPHDKTQAIIDLANILQQENLIDGIGMQSYIGVTWPNLDDYFNGLERLITSTGLEIQITELTITPPIGDNWLGAQAEQYYEYFNRLLSYIKNGYNISSVTVYGLQDGYRFYTKDSTKTRLLDHDLKKKPNFNAIINVLKNYNEAVASDNIIEISEIKEEEENKKIKEKEKEKEKIIDNDDEEKGEKEVKKVNEKEDKINVHTDINNDSEDENNSESEDGSESENDSDSEDDSKSGNNSEDKDNKREKEKVKIIDDEDEEKGEKEVKKVNEKEDKINDHTDINNDSEDGSESENDSEKEENKGKKKAKSNKKSNKKSKSIKSKQNKKDKHNKEKKSKNEKMTKGK